MITGHAAGLELNSPCSERNFPHVYENGREKESDLRIMFGSVWDHDHVIFGT
jgi:hypothetical protein